MALLLAFAGPLSGSGTVPFGLIFLCVLQVVAFVVTRSGEAAFLARSWLIAVIVTSGLLPLLALQANLLREPYVGAGRDSAMPALISTFVVVLFIVVVAIWCTVAFSSTSEVAAVAFAPLALLVPGILGIGATIGQRTALEGLAESSLFAAGAAVLAWSLPRNVRLMVPPVAFVVQVVMLWAAGRGPSFPETSGGVLALLYWVTIVVTAAMIVVLPVASAWLRRSIEAVQAAERPRREDAGKGEPRR